MYRNHETSIGAQVEILSLVARDFSSTAQYFACTGESSFQRSTQTIFHRNFETASLHLRECTRHWLFDGIVQLLLHLDRSSTEMCSLQLPCPGSFSHIQTGSNYSWLQDQNFLVKSNSPKPQHRQTKNCPWKNCQGRYVCADSSISELVSDFGFSRPDQPVTLVRTFGTFGFSLTLFLLFPLPSLLEHDLFFFCLCQIIACRCLCVHCSFVVNVLHRT